MASGGGFHFVNPDNDSATGHKAKAKARAFVARKSRADWSTKSNNKNDRRKFVKKFISSMIREPVTSICQGTKKGASANVTQETEKKIDGSGRTLQESDSNSMQYSRRRPETCIFCGVSLDEPAMSTGVGACPFCARCCVSEPVKQQLPMLDGHLSPYGSAAVKIEPSDINLLAFFNAAISPQISSSTIRPLQHAPHYLIPLLNNSACMYAFLCLTALQLGILQYDKRADYLLQAMQFRLQAVTAIQSNLSDLQSAASDENIAAVFNLLCVEENLFLPSFDDNIGGSKLRPDHAQRLVHMNGLKGLISMRGGVISLGKTRALQMFLIRHSAVQAAVSFESSYFLPRDSLSTVFHYPDSSSIQPESCPMATVCATRGLSLELAGIIESAECLMRDTAAWFKNPGTLTGGRDLLDIQNLFSVIISRFVQWHQENSATCTPVEGITSLCLIIFMCFVMRGRQTVYGPLPSCLLRLRPYFGNSSILENLQDVGIDVWIGLLLVIGSAGYNDLEDYFFQIYLQIIHKNEIQSFDHLMRHLKSCIWISRPMSLYAWEIWAETPDIVKHNRTMLSSKCDSSFQREDMSVYMLQKRNSVVATRPVSLLGFPAFKLDHTDSTLFQE